MIDEELKALWHSRCAPVQINTEQLSATIAQSLSKMQLDVRRRDRREIGAAIVLVPAFAAMAIFMQHATARSGAILGLVWSITCVVILYGTARTKPSDIGTPYRSYLLQIHKYTLRQKRLLDMALWWYVLPFVASCSLIFISFSWWHGVVTVLGLGVVITWLNKRTATTYFTPLLHDINSELLSLEEEEPRNSE